MISNAYLCSSAVHILSDPGNSWQCLAFATEAPEAHIYTRTDKPQWWPNDWDWAAKALEAARREEMDSFFIIMRDWQAKTEVQPAISGAEICTNDLYF